MSFLVRVGLLPAMLVSSAFTFAQAYPVKTPP